MQSTSPSVARVDELLQLAHARVVEEQVARHQHEAARLGERDELLHLGGAHRRRLLDEDVLAGLERLLGERVVGRDGRRDHDRLELGVGEQLVVGAGRERVREAPRELLAARLRGVADPDEVGEDVEVADEVLRPRRRARPGRP